MSCTVRIASPLRSYTGGAAVVSANGESVTDVLADLERRFPGMRFRMIDEQDRMRRHVRFFVNGEATFDLGLAVTRTDEVCIVQALSGG